MSALLLVALLLAPAGGFIIGFLAGTIRQLVSRVIVGAIVILFPSAYFLILAFGPSASADDRFAAAFGLVVLGLHIGLWTLFGTLGVLVGAAKARGPR